MARHCEVCDQALAPHTRRDAKYCSNVCRQAAHRERQIRRREVERRHEWHSNNGAVSEMTEAQAEQWAEKLIARNRQLRRERHGDHSDSKPAEPQVYSVESAAERLGYGFTVSWLRARAREGEIPHFLLGTGNGRGRSAPKIMFTMDDLHEIRRRARVRPEAGDTPM